MTALWCAFCRQPRPADDLLAVWRRSDPRARWYVCRPSLPARVQGECFLRCVGPVSEHAIAPATEAGSAGLSNPAA